MSETLAKLSFDIFAKELEFSVCPAIIFLFILLIYRTLSLSQLYFNLDFTDRFRLSETLVAYRAFQSQKLKRSFSKLYFPRIFHLILFLVHFFCISGLELKAEETFYEILNLNLEASTSEIKKSYRQLALEYHPDKIFQLNPNLVDIEKSLKNDIFLKIQEAYEVLHDAEKRLQYDLKLTGVQYDIIDHDDTETNPYMTQPFHLFVKSNRPKFKFHFFANFDKPRIPDINVRLDVSLEHLLKGLEKKHKFYRRVICNKCGGNGGLDGQCKKCDLCQGSGVAKLLYSHTKNDNAKCESNNCERPKHNENRNGMKYGFEQMTETKCPSCKGKGCFPTGKCINCNGAGTKMIETEIMIIVPKSFKNGIVLSLENSGHETVDGRKGTVLVNINYVIPFNWVLLEESYVILYNKLVSFEDLVEVKEFQVISPLGDELTVKMPKIDFQLSHLLVGFNITMKGYGLLTGETASIEVSDLIDLDDENRSMVDGKVEIEEARGDLIVHCDVDWNSITKDTFQNLLLDSGWEKTDPIYLRICALLDSCDNNTDVTEERDIYEILPREITIVSRQET